MSEDKIYDIVHDYVNQNISEDMFLSIKAQHPAIEWDAMIQEERFIQEMFQAKAYGSLEQKIAKDIDEIESKNLFKRIAIASAVIISVLTAGYFILSSDKTTKNSENKLEEIETSSELLVEDNRQQIKLTEGADIEKQQKVFEKTKLPDQRAKQKFQKEEVVIPKEIQDSAQQTKSNNQPIETKTEPMQISQGLKELIKTEEQIPADEVEPTIPVEEIDVDNETTVAVKKDVIEIKNYIINPSMYDNLEVQSFGYSVRLFIKSMNSEVVYDYSYDEFEPIVWEGKDLNENTLPIGLYIYQIYKEGTVIQFGQITITK